MKLMVARVMEKLFIHLAWFDSPKPAAVVPGCASGFSAVDVTLAVVLVRLLGFSFPDETVEDRLIDECLTDTAPTIC